LFDLLRVLPNSGIGSKVAKQNWREERYWEVTRIKIDPDGSHGKVWGTPYWKGKPEPTANGDTRIPGPLKTFWELRESNLSPAMAAWASQDWTAVKERLRSADPEGGEAASVEEAET